MLRPTTTAIALGGATATSNGFPWALVALGVGGAGVLVLGGYLVAWFLAHRQESDRSNQ